MLEQLIKDCIAACKAALKKCETLSSDCKANLTVCITACEQLQADPGATACCCEECYEAASSLMGCKDDCCKAAEIACTACAVACRQVMYRSEKHRICRFIKLDSSKINREKRTIPLSFSSEYPALQRSRDEWPDIFKEAGIKDGQVYVEILDHDPENVDLSLLRNHGAFLDQHDSKDHLGVVEDVEISEHIGRAVVRMGSDDKAKLRFDQMADNVRPHISVGARYTKFIRSEKLPNGRVAHRFAWKALEISSVDAPADPTIGVARSYQDLPQVDSPNIPNAVNSPKVMLEKTDVVVVDEKQIRTAARDGFRKRSAEITKAADALVKEFGKRDGGQMESKIRSIAGEYLDKDGDLSSEHFTTGADFMQRCMTDVMKAKPAVAVGLEEVLDPIGQKHYSVIRGIQSAFTNREKGNGGIPDEKSPEGEAHYNALKKARSEGGLGFSPAGFLVPHDACLRSTGLTVKQRREMGRMTRDMTAGVFPSGGATVPTTMELPVIEILRNMEVLEQTGWCRTLSGLTGNVIIPRQDAASTAYAVAEIQALTASQAILGQIALTPHRVGATQNYSKQLVFQSAIDIDAFIRDDMFQVIALKWDYLGMFGQGAQSEPLGIVNTPGVQSIVFGGTPTYKQFLAMVTALRKANVRTTISFASSPATEGSLRGVAVTLTGATTVVGGAQNAIWTPDNKLAGYDAVESNQIAGDIIIGGGANEAIRGLWAGLDIVVDVFTLAPNAEVKLTINTWGDFAVRHPQTFIVSADSGAQ